MGPALRGKIVECGSCEQQFRVDDEVVVKAKKFYPGERRDPLLDRFSRVPAQRVAAPIATGPPAPAVVDRAAILPGSPFRVLMGLVGVIIAALVVMILIFGTGPGGLVHGAPLERRLLLAGFAGVLCLVLLVAANPLARWRGVLGGLAANALLLTLPFVFREGEPTVADGAGTLAGLEISNDAPDVGDPLEDVREEVGYAPLEAAIKAREGLPDGGSAVGLWLRDLRDFNKLQILDFMKRKTGASEQSWLYPRPPTDFLLVLDGVDETLGEIEQLARSFGTIRRRFDDLRLIEVQVDNNVFVQGPQDRLQDRDDPAFYELNRRELESIDLQRAGEAVKRLAGAEPKIFRNDIVIRLHDLMDEADPEMKRDIAAALIVWAEPGDGSVPLVRRAAEELVREEGRVPTAIMTFLVRSGDDSALPILGELWREEPDEWELLLGDAGPEAEAEALKGLEAKSASTRFSAVRLLRRIGTARSLPALREARGQAQGEFIALIEQAIAAIEKRGN